MVKFPLTCLVVIFLIAIQCSKINLAMFAAGAVCGIVGPLAIVTIIFNVMGIDFGVITVTEEELKNLKEEKEEEDGDKEV